MVMHARKIPRLNDGYFDRNQAHPYENSGGKYTKSPFGENEKSPLVGEGAMASPENNRRPSPRYPHKGPSSYAQRLKERDHVKSPMANKERNNRSHSSSTHHHNTNSSNQPQHSNANSSSRSKSSGSTESATSGNMSSRSNHDRSHIEPESEKDRRTQVGDWSEHVSSSGKKYYYNCRTEVSQWEKPREWVDYEKLHSSHKSASTEQQQQQVRNRDKGNSSRTVTERHSNSSSSSTAPRSSHSQQQHQRDRDSHHNRAHGDQRHEHAQASSGSSSSSNSSHSSNSSRAVAAATAVHHSTSSRKNEETLSRLEEEKESRLETNRNHYHHHHASQLHNSTSSASSSRRTGSRKDSSQDMEISPDSSCDLAQQSSGRETPRSTHHPLNSTSRTPKAEANYNNNSATPNSGPIVNLPQTPTSGAAPSTQLLSPSQVTLANLPRLISQMAGTRGLPNLAELSQQEALQTIQQALQLTKQLGGMNRSPHAGGGVEGKSVFSSAIISAALRGDQPNQNFYTPSERRNDGCLSPGSDCHSHSSRQTSPGSSGSPTTAVPVNNLMSNVTTSVAAAIAAQGPSLKPSPPSLTPTLSNYFRDDLITHVTGWQADHAERQATRYSEDGHNIGSLNCTRVSAELKMARSLVRLAEIQATLQEQRILFLRQQVKELEDRRSQNSFMMDS